MIHSSKALPRWLRAVAGGLAALSAAVLIAACGGSTSQYEAFVAQRVFAFGDELSALRSDGRRYGVNGLTAATEGATPTFNCGAEPVWVQRVASLYGLVYAECNTGTPPVEPRAFMHAAAGAKVADIAAQISAREAAGGFRDKDLALVMGGMNDVLELYAQFPQRSEAELIAEARARGTALALQVNRLIDLGARVIVANLPDFGLSPFARAESAQYAATGFDRAGLISRLTVAFNESLGVRIRLDGRFVGLAMFDLRSQQIGRFPSSFNFANGSDAACAVAPPDCTTATLVNGASSGTWFWAHGTLLTGGGQSQLSLLAEERAVRNPF